MWKYYTVVLFKALRQPSQAIKKWQILKTRLGFVKSNYFQTCSLQQVQGVFFLKIMIYKLTFVVYILQILCQSYWDNYVC